MLASRKIIHKEDIDGNRLLFLQYLQMYEDLVACRTTQCCANGTSGQANLHQGIIFTIEGQIFCTLGGTYFNSTNVNVSVVDTSLSSTSV